MPYAEPLQFPSPAPDGFPPLAREPEFDASRHLALEKPDTIISLEELGYSDEDIASCPSSLGITSCFRVLSDEGVACLQEVTRNLLPYARNIKRISRAVRGGVYQSKFLRDLCLSPDVSAVVSECCQSEMLPHTIPHQLGHLNYNPETVGENVDKWHVDTLRIDYVMFVTDPSEIAGGEFQYFNGTKYEMEGLVKAGEGLPEERIMSPVLPGPGYAVLQQGNMVVHRAKGLREAGERITMVNGYVPREIGYPDYTRFDQLYLADPKPVATAEYARHVAWMGREMLRDPIENPLYGDDKERIASQLDAVIATLSHAAKEIRDAGTKPMEHFGDG